MQLTIYCLLLLVSTGQIFAGPNDGKNTSVDTPTGTLEVHNELPAKMAQVGSNFTSFDELQTNIRKISPAPRLIFSEAQGHGGETRILAQEFRRNKPVVVVTDNLFTVELVQKAANIAERSDIRVYFVADQKTLQWNGFKPPKGTDLVVFQQKPPRAADPYDTGGNNNFASSRHDGHGRDLVANFLFEMANTSKVSQVEIIDYGGKSTDTTFEVINRAKSEGFKPGSAGLMFRMFDLTIDGKAGAWGPQAFDLMANWDRVQQSFRETSKGAQALGFIDIDFRLYNAETPKEVQRGMERRAWLDGKVPTDFVSIGAVARRSEVFVEFVDKRLRLLWGIHLSLQAEEKAMMDNDPRLEQGLRPLVVPSAQKARDLSWGQLTTAYLKAEAFELTALEDRLFEPTSPLLDAARKGTIPSIPEATAKTDSVYRARIEAVGEAQAAHELTRFNSLNRKFHDLIAANDASSLDTDSLYPVRRATFGRGIDLGGRWEPSLKKCWDILSRLSPQ